MAADLDLLYKLIVQDEGKRVLKQHQATLKKLTAQEKKAIKVSKQQEKAAQAQTKAIDKQRKAREKQTKALKQNLKQAAATMAIVGVAALALGAKAVQMASNVEEASQKFDQVFGPAAKRTGEAIDEFAESANRSRFALREMAADVGAVLEPMLGSKIAASDMSVQLTKLTTDLSSFNNVAESDVMVALRSGLIGNMEPMLQFGVVLRQSKVNAEVLASGMADTKDEITEAMRVTARFNIIMRETATAQGDAERTSDSFANQLRGFQASAEVLFVTVGKTLIPIAKDVVKFLKEVFDEIDRIFNATGRFNTAISKTARAGATGAKSYTEYTQALQEHTDEMAKNMGGANLQIDAQGNLIRVIGDGIFRTERLVQANVQLTEAQFNTMQQGALLEETDRALIAARSSLINKTDLLVEAEENNIQTAADLKVQEEKLKAVQEAATETARRRAESLESMRKAAANAAIAHDDLAASLSEATKAEFASAGIDLLKEKLNAGEIGAFEFEQATRNLMLANGLATEQSFAQADALEEVVGLYADNKISAEELTTATALLKDAGLDGEIAMSDLGLTVADYTENADLALRATQEYDEALGEWVQVSDDAITRGNLLKDTYRAIEEDTRANIGETAEFKDELKQVVGLFSELTAREWIITTRFETSGEPPTPTTNAQSGFHGTVTGPHLFRIEPGVTEQVDISPAGNSTTNNRTTNNTFNQTINTSQAVDLGRDSNINRNKARSF